MIKAKACKKSLGAGKFEPGLVCHMVLPPCITSMLQFVLPNMGFAIDYSKAVQWDKSEPVHGSGEGTRFLRYLPSGQRQSRKKTARRIRKVMRTRIGWQDSPSGRRGYRNLTRKSGKMNGVFLR